MSSRFGVSAVHQFAGGYISIVTPVGRLRFGELRIETEKRSKCSYFRRYTLLRTESNRNGERGTYILGRSFHRVSDHSGATLN